MLVKESVWKTRRDVLQAGLEEQEGAAGEEAGGDDGDDPGYAWGGRPAEHEEGGGEEDPTDHGYGEAFFWDEV